MTRNVEGRIMRRNGATKVLVAALVSTMLLTACGGESTTSSSSNTTSTSTSSSSTSTAATTEAEPAAAEEQVLNLVYTELNLIDVNDVRNSNEFIVLSEVQEGLFRTLTNEQGEDELTYAGCESYDISDDLLTYTFHLRKECKWNDGVAVTAQNYVDSWIRLLDPEKAFSYAFLAEGIVGASEYMYEEGSVEDVAVAVVDDYTFTATLVQPDPSFIKKVSMVCFYPIRKELVDAAEANGGNWTNDYKLHVYNGPFYISNRILENSMTLTKNENYWDKDNIKLETVNLQVVAETGTQAQLMEAQQVDLLKLEDLEYVDLWSKLVDGGTFVRTEKTSPSNTYISFDMHKDGNGGPSGLMDNAKCRLAITLAFDREEYVAMFQNGLAVPAYSLVPYDMNVGSTEFRSKHDELLATDEYAKLAADPAALKALFDEGKAEEGVTGDVTLTTIIYSPTTETTNINEWYKQQLESKLGVKVNVETYPDVSTWKEARNSYKYDFYTMGWFADYDDPENFLQLFTSFSGYGKFMGGFSNEEYDALYNEAVVTLDDAKRLELYSKAEDILLSEGGVCPLIFPINQFYSQSYVKGITYPTFGAEYDFSRAYIAK